MAHRIWLVGQFNEITYEMNDVQIIQEREDGSYQTEYNAKSAAWMDDLWWFENMTIQQYDEDSNPMGRPAERRAMEIPGLSETPKDFLAGIRKEQTFMSARDLATFVNARPNLSKRGQARYLTDLHYRLAIPWACLVMTLVGIPTGGQTGRHGAFLGVFLSITFFFVYYAFVIFFVSFGKSGSLSPIVAAWTPNAAFLMLGITLLYRMR